MGLRDIAETIQADNKRLVMHQTWGHLFPEDGLQCEGRILLTETIYGDCLIIDEDIDIPASPWWHSAVHEWAGEWLGIMDKVGAVFDVDVKVNIERRGDQRSFKIEVQNIRFIYDIREGE